MMNDFFKHQKSSTDLNNILKCFYEYFKVYKLATNKSVSKWKLADVENAIKWSKLIEDIYCKLNKKPYYDKLFSNIITISQHWSVDERDVDEAVSKPVFKLRNALITNKYLNAIHREYLLNEVYNKDESMIVNEGNGESEEMVEAEVDKLCLKIDKMCKEEQHSELRPIKLMINYIIDKQDGEDFVIQLLFKLKDFCYEGYRKLIIYLINLNKYTLLVNHKLSVELLSAVNTDEQLLQLYFSYLIFLYTNESPNLLSIDRLAEHFMNAIRSDKTTKYEKLLRKNAEKEPKWNILVNKIKFFYFAASCLNIDLMATATAADVNMEF